MKTPVGLQFLGPFCCFVVIEVVVLSVFGFGVNYGVVVGADVGDGVAHVKCQRL